MVDLMGLEFALFVNPHYTTIVQKNDLNTTASQKGIHLFQRKPGFSGRDFQLLSTCFDEYSHYSSPQS
jgi:hypothetical protein